MGKHQQRRERKARYRQMLRRELDDEKAFARRIARTILFSKNGEDIAHDGKPIKADLFGAIRQWEGQDPQSARACLSLIEQVVRQIQVQPTLNR